MASWRRRKSLWILFAASTAREFYGRAIGELAQFCEEKSYTADYRVLDGDNEFSGRAQLDQFHKFLDRRGSYSGCVLISPAITDNAFTERVLQFCRANHRFPLITIDLNFADSPASNPPQRDTYYIPPCVKVDDYMGAQLAAKSLYQYWRDEQSVPENDIRRKVVYILKGNHAKSREEGFCVGWEAATGLEAAAVRTQVKVRYIERWSFFSAMNHARGFLQQEQVDAFFCCNDEMTLGARVAVLQATAAGFQRQIPLIGFDGNEAVRELAQLPEETGIIDTIVTNIEEQVQTAMHLLDGWIQSATRPTRYQLPLPIVPRSVRLRE